MNTQPNLPPKGRGRGRGVRLPVAAPAPIPLLSPTTSYTTSTHESESDTSDAIHQLRFKPNLHKVNKLERAKEDEQSKVVKNWTTEGTFGDLGIQRKSDAVLLVEDVKQSQELAFGYDEDYMDKHNIRRTKLPTSIVRRGDKYFTKTDAKMETGEEDELLVHIMCVDEDDTFHVRIVPKDEVQAHKQKYKIPKEENFEQLLEHMDLFYEQPASKGATSVGINNWFPEVGEVVVIQITRKYYMNSRFRDFIAKQEYQRATLLQIGEGYVTAQLLDEFGSGGVLMQNVFRIQPSMTKLHAQMFQIELANMEYVKQFKLIHKVLRCMPVEGTMKNNIENVCGLQWMNKGKDKRSLPPAALTFRLPILCSDKEFVSIREHVIQNFPSFISPYASLTKGESLCKVLRYEGNGCLWIRMECDRDRTLLSQLYTTLEELREKVEKTMFICPLSIADLLNPEPKDLTQLFIALLPSKQPKVKKLRRVKIVGYNDASDEVQVINIDSGRAQLVSITNLLRLDDFHKELASIPPQALKVHLLHVKRVSTQAKEVKTVLFSGPRRVVLAYDWPVPIVKMGYTPEVLLYPDTESEADIKFESMKSRISGRLSGLAELLVASKWAIGYTGNEIKCRELIYERVETFKKNEDRDFANKHFSTFIGNTFQFSFTLDQLPVAGRLAL